MSFQKKWSDVDVATARDIVAAAPTRTRGYELAAKALGTTTRAVVCLLDRADGKRRKSKPEAPQPPADVLDGYTAKLAEKAERSRVKVMETDLYTMRKVVDTFSAVTSKPLEPVKRYELNSGMREATAFALLSDVHCEEHVRLGETPVPNVYNPAIADRSIRRFFAGFRWLIDMHRQAFKIRHAGLWLGGDLMTGHIHDENKENTEGPPIATLLWLRPRIIAGIDFLLDDPELERLDVPCSYGNHGRNTHKPFRALGAVHSYEWLLYQILAGHYEGNPRVRFLADQSAHQYMRAYDWDLHFHHGDETSYQGGVGGITIPINKAVAQWDIARKCHFHNFGHWHQYNPGGRVAMNGSVIGYSAYSMSIKAAPEDPQQAFYLLDSKRGKTCSSPIWVRDSADIPKAVA